MKKLLLILLAACPVWAQVAKKQLTEADYSLWHTLEQEQLSEDGNWVSYSFTYASGKDTLFVKHTQKANKNTKITIYLLRGDEYLFFQNIE